MANADIVLPTTLATYMTEPSGVIAIPKGPLPTGGALMKVNRPSEPMAKIEMVSFAAFATYRKEPLGVMATPSGPPWVAQEPSGQSITARKLLITSLNHNRTKGKKILTEIVRYAILTFLKTRVGEAISSCLSHRGCQSRARSDDSATERYRASGMRRQ